MASDRTERATPKRREEARKRGQVARSQEVGNALGLLALFSILAVLGGWLLGSFRELMADGLAPETPVAILEKGTLPDARALRTLLADLGGAVEREAVQSPAVLVVGEVVRLGDAEDLLGSIAARAFA